MSFCEGCYRLPGEPWKVFTVTKYDVPEPEMTDSVWASGVEGPSIRFPAQRRLDRMTIEECLTERLGVLEWLEVRGPDSIVLR